MKRLFSINMNKKEEKWFNIVLALFLIWLGTGLLDYGISDDWYQIKRNRWTDEIVSGPRKLLKEDKIIYTVFGCASLIYSGYLFFGLFKTGLKGKE